VVMKVLRRGIAYFSGYLKKLHNSIVI